jgi:hypothetical protein
MHCAAATDPTFLTRLNRGRSSNRLNSDKLGRIELAEVCPEGSSRRSSAFYVLAETSAGTAGYPL